MIISNVGTSTASEEQSSINETIISGNPNTPSNIRTENAACCIIGDDDYVSARFDFSIPPNAIITGFEVKSLMKRQTGGTPTYRIRIRGGESGDWSDSKSTSSMAWEGTPSCTSLGWTTLGGNNDLWGLEWTAEDVNTVTRDNLEFAQTATATINLYIDHIIMKVYYTLGEGTFEDSQTNPSSAESDPEAKWQGESNIRLDDNNCANTPSGVWETDAYIESLHTNFNIPTDAIITGIQLNVKAGRDAGPGGAGPIELKTRIRKGDSTWTSWTAYQNTGNSSTCDFSNHTFGGQYDLWGETWTPADFNSPAAYNVTTFTYFPYDINGGPGLTGHNIQYVEMIVYYNIASDLVISKMIVQTTRGANGFIQATVPDQDLLNLATFETYLKQPISVFDDEKTKFLGAYEFQKLKVTTNEVMLEGVEYTRKALKCRSNSNPVQLTGVIDGIVDEYFYDWDDLSGNGRLFEEFQNLHISFKDTDVLNAYYLGNSETGFVDDAGDPFVPDGTDADYRWTQFTEENGDWAGAGGGGYVWSGYVDAAVGNHEWAQQYKFTVLVKSGTNALSLTFGYATSFQEIGKYSATQPSTTPYFQVWNDDSSAWEVLYQPDGSAGTSTTYFEGELVIESSISDYLNYVRTVNGYEEYEVIFQIHAGETPTTTNIISTAYMRLQVYYDASQAITLGEGKTLTTTSGDSIGRKRMKLVDDSDFDLPSTFGVTQYDTYVIGTNMKTAIDAAWEAHALNNQQTLTFDSTTTGADFIDRTNDSLWDILASYAKILDREIWASMDDPYDTKCKSSYTSTGLTITEDDIVNINVPQSWNYVIDTENLYDAIFVIGQTPIIEGNVTIVNEFSAIEELVVNDGKIASVTSANDKADGLQYLHTNAIRSLTFDLNMNKGTDYSNLGVCKTLSVNIWSGVIILTDYLIDSLTFQQEAGGDLFATVTVIRRDHEA